MSTRNRDSEELINIPYISNSDRFYPIQSFLVANSQLAMARNNEKDRNGAQTHIVETYPIELVLN